MEHEMININAHLVKDVIFSSFETEDGIVPVVNFSLVKNTERVRNTLIVLPMATR